MQRSYDGIAQENKKLIENQSELEMKKTDEGTRNRHRKYNMSYIKYQNLVIIKMRNVTEEKILNNIWRHFSIRQIEYK